MHGDALFKVLDKFLSSKKKTINKVGIPMTTFDKNIKNAGFKSFYLPVCVYI